MGNQRNVIVRGIIIAAALLLACGEEPNQDNVPRTHSGDDGRRLFFSDKFLNVDVSYNRTLLAYVEPFDPKNPFSEFPLFVYNFETGKKIAVAERAGHPVFSPDGEWIAYQKLVGSGDLWLVKSDGSGGRPLVEFAGMETPTSWSPDGKKILFHTFLLETEIWFYYLEREKASLVFKETTPRGNVVPSPVWAASGEEIFFCRETAEGAAISRIGADGTGLVDIWPYDPTSYGVQLKAAIPQGDRLLLTVRETVETGGRLEGRTAAWFFDLKSRRFEQLTYNPNPARINDMAVRLYPDNVLVFASHYRDEDDKTGVYVIKTP